MEVTDNREANALRFYYLHFPRERGKPHHTGPPGVYQVGRETEGVRRKLRPEPLLGKQGRAGKQLRMDWSE